MNDKFRKQFPILEKIVYLDSAALVQKPLSVIKANEEYYSNFAVSTHSPDSLLGIKAVENINLTREKIANFIDATPEEIIFTSGATQSLNFIALMLKKILKNKEEIILSNYNHSSNMVPWIEISKEKNLKIIFLDNEDETNILNNINEKTKIISLSQVNNSLLKKKNLRKIYEECQKRNIILINDAAQAALSEKISLKQESDVVALSSNKMFGPTGVGILAIKKTLLDKLEPAYYGGGSVVSMNDYIWHHNNTNESYEAGTPNLAGIYQFSKAIDFVNQNIDEKAKKYLMNLSKYLYQNLKLLKDIEIISKEEDYIAVFRFLKFPSQDIVSFLGHNNIYTRSGDFCAKNLKFLKQNNGYIRVSLSYYNNKEDIDKMINLLKKEDFLGFL